MFASYAHIEGLGIQIGAVGPTNDTEFRMDSYLAELDWIAEPLKNSVELDYLIQRDYTLDSILKPNLQAKWIGRRNGNDVFHLTNVSRQGAKGAKVFSATLRLCLKFLTGAWF